jgi:uroporphyrinogen-III decarboxylase
MEKNFYINLANSGLRMPIGADLVLHEKDNYKECLNDGKLLGKVLEETASRYKTPLAIALMDLMLEKSVMLKMIGVPDEEAATYHFTAVPDNNIINTINEKAGKLITKRIAADIGAIEYIAKETDLIPFGMSIGPFSLLTKLVDDPITAVYLAGAGGTADEDDEIKMIETLLETVQKVILSYIELKIKAGAKGILVAEPAANKVYFSPKQLDEGSNIFERYVMKYNYQIKELLDKYKIDFIFHCCGEITDYMLKQFCKLNPVILSLGSSRVLWEDANIVPKDIVLYGNLPSKKFYSDEEISIDEVKKKSKELIENMKKAKHHFKLGSECDVLFVKEKEKKILAKVDAFMNC